MGAPIFDVCELGLAADAATGNVRLAHWRCGCFTFSDYDKAQCGAHLEGMTVDPMDSKLEHCRRCESTFADPLWRCENCGVDI